jgi:hypothetical protein
MIDKEIMSQKSTTNISRPLVRPLVSLRAQATTTTEKKFRNTHNRDGCVGTSCADDDDDESLSSTSVRALFLAVCPWDVVEGGFAPDRFPAFADEPGCGCRGPWGFVGRRCSGSCRESAAAILRPEIFLRACIPRQFTPFRL